MKRGDRPGQSKRTSADRVRIWQWPNVLGLDAALVALLWQRLYAAEWGLAAPPATGAVLALSVWLAYTADRIFDIRGRPLSTLLSVRHRFMKRRRTAMACIWLAVLAADLALAFVFLGPPDLWAGVPLLAACLAYTAWNALRPRRRFAKEVLIGLLFAAGVAAFLHPPPGAAWRFALSLFPFAAVCAFNCLLVAAAERPVDRALGTPGAGGFRRPDRSLPAAGLLVLASVLLAPTPALVAALASAQGALLLLAAGVRRFDREFLRVVADAVLALAALAALAS